MFDVKVFYEWNTNSRHLTYEIHLIQEEIKNKNWLDNVFRKWANWKKRYHWFTARFLQNILLYLPINIKEFGIWKHPQKNELKIDKDQSLTNEKKLALFCHVQI